MPTVDSQPGVAPAPPPSTWRAEPFRAFFPLGVVLGWAGVGTWILYDVGAIESYSCLSHGLIQTQAFLPAFAVGFLMTAIPRRTRSAAPSALEVSLPLALLPAIALALLGRRWVLGQAAYVVLFAGLLVFAARRFVGSGGARRPPAAFVLLPIGLLAGVAGSLLLVAGMTVEGGARLASLGALLVEQAVFLCFTIGVGSLVLPLVGGEPPPADLGSSPRETRLAALYALAGGGIVASVVLEAAGHDRLGPALRGAIVALGLGGGAGAWRAPGKPGLHRRLVWLGAWLIPTGLLAAALWPDYRVPALHVTLIGGFGLLTFGVASHVVFSHLGLEIAAAGRPRAVIALTAGLLLALGARVAADASHTYFLHLAWAAGTWIVGTGVWLVWALPRLLDRRPAPSL